MTRTASKPPPDPERSTRSLIFSVLAGLFLFLTIIKLGDPIILSYPIILDNTTRPPASVSDAYYFSWPTSWGYLMSIPLFVAGLVAVPWNRLKFRWILLLPALWLGWEFVASTQTAGPELTRQTVAHFTACVALFYLGYFALQGNPIMWPIWAGISLALCWVIHSGVEQHFGGLEATRRLLYSTDNPLAVSPATLKNPDFLKRLASNRIYATFVYANAFAGALVLILPLSLVFLWRLTPKVRFLSRVGMVVVLGCAALACLYWSGSKAGWLVALTVGLIALSRSAMPLTWKRGLICGVLIIGVAGFAVKYAGFFQKEHNSVGARFAYWRAALLVIRAHPWVGTGPGTFQIPYRELKHLDDEPTRLCHNDYLEQASDSGIPGLIAYTVMILVLLYELYRYSSVGMQGEWMGFAVWLGVFGVCLHSMVEFHLYIPALSWTQFFLFGWLASRLD